MPATPDEQGRADVLAEAAGHDGGAISGAFLRRMILGYVGLRDHIAALTAQADTLEQRIAALEQLVEPPPPAGE